MDINYLLHRQQIETTRARSASCDASRLAHQELADRYASQIHRYGARARPGA